MADKAQPRKGESSEIHTRANSVPLRPSAAVELLPSLGRWEPFKRTVVAFSNRPEGGTIWVGVRPGGPIVGIQPALARYRSADHLRNAIYSAIRDSVEPPSVDLDVEMVTVDGQTALRVRVYPGAQLPYRLGQVYVRDGCRTRPATAEEHATMTRRREQQERARRRRRWLTWALGGLILLAGLAVLYVVGSCILVAHLTRFQRIAADPEGMTMTNPALSPDGKTALIVLYPDDEPQAKDIYIIRPGGAAAVSLAPHPATDDMPQFSPDGQHIVFCSDRATPGTLQLYEMRADGSDAHRLSEQPHCANPVYAPDGRTIAFDAPDENGARQIFFVARDGSSQRQVTHGPQRHEHPAFGPDGVWLAYASERESNWDIYRLDLTNGLEQRVTHHPAADYAPTFIGGDGHILFESERYIWRALCLASPDGRKVVQLTHFEMDESSAALGGHWIVLEADHNPRRGLYRLPYRPQWFETWQYQELVRKFR